LHPYPCSEYPICKILKEKRNKEKRKQKTDKTKHENEGRRISRSLGSQETFFDA
jgi:hypothetical protein